jgi:metal-sulfur cluster biosynthetic enzyme
LVYSLQLHEAPGGANVEVRMTLTAPGCGMGPVIAQEARQKIAQLSGVAEADVQVVWEPPWNPDMISEEGKMKLGMS